MSGRKEKDVVQDAIRVSCRSSQGGVVYRVCLDRCSVFSFDKSGARTLTGPARRLRFLLNMWDCRWMRPQVLLSRN